MRAYSTTYSNAGNIKFIAVKGRWELRCLRKLKSLARQSSACSMLLLCVTFDIYSAACVCLL